MAYNNGYPVGYGYQQYYPTQLQQQQAQSNGIIWVQGEAGAKSYLVAPNTTVQLWDSESQTIYLKSADASGMPSIKVLDYTIREAQQSNNQPKIELNSSYATKDELIQIKDELEQIKSRLNERRNNHAKLNADAKSNKE